jgi:predicted enzyme related to lactoylglutathione lyase
MREDGKIDYVEFPASGIPAVKAFYSAAFGWTWVDYGPDYAAFADAAVDGGFNGDADDPGRADQPLVVLYAHDIEAMAARVTAAGGVIVKPIYSFPGGRRFHFTDPSGNELAVWSET